MATDPYSVAQDVASACRTFLGECYYDTAIGIPYFEQILGQFPPLTLVKTLLADAAAQVPGCNNPIVYITSFKDRVITGQVQFTDSNQQTQIVNITSALGQFILGQSSLGGLDTI